MGFSQQETDSGLKPSANEKVERLDESLLVEEKIKQASDLVDQARQDASRLEQVEQFQFEPGSGQMAFGLLEGTFAPTNGTHSRSRISRSECAGCR